MSDRRQTEVCRRALKDWGWNGVRAFGGHYIEAFLDDSPIERVTWCVPALYRHVKDPRVSATDCPEHPR